VFQLSSQKFVQAHDIWFGTHSSELGNMAHLLVVTSVSAATPQMSRDLNPFIEVHIRYVPLCSLQDFYMHPVPQ
jgi:hypothetical protein